MIRVFNDSKYGTIRTAVVKGEPSFCLKDVCQMLDIKSIPECRGKLNESGIRLIDVDEGGSRKKMLFITADNLSGCLFQSPKAEAEQICEWLYLTVLPRLKTYVIIMWSNLKIQMLQ